MVNRTPGPAMDFLKQFKALASFSQLFESNSRNVDPVRIDNIIFKLHSNYTVLILLVGTTFLTCKTFGDPIECLSSNNNDISAKLLQNWCWLEGSFSVVGSDGKAAVGHDVAYPGVKTFNEANGERRRSHKYYQWIYFVLIIQAILFYMPKYLWKVKEANRLQMMIINLKAKNVRDYNENEKRKITQDVVDSLLISNDYFFFYFFCEFIYYIHLVAQMWFINLMLSGQFLRLGIEWLNYNHSNDEHADPLIRVFPRMAKCVFHKYGYSGSIETSDSMCFLTMNIVNEKLFVILWFWFGIVFVITSFSLLQRVLLVLLPTIRYKKMCELAPSTDRKSLRMLTSRIGNYFILHHIAKNIRPHYFRDLIDIVVNDYFDDKCNVVYNKQAKNQSLNQMPQIMNAGNQSKQKKGGIKKSFGKSKGFVSVNRDPILSRDPPSGHSQSSSSEEWPIH